MIRTGSAGLAEARRLHALGVEHNNAGHPLRAIRLFRRALASPVLTEGADEEARLVAARIWISVAMSESELKSPERGLAALAEAERLIELAEHPQLNALLHLQKGYITVRAGHFEAGLAHLDSAVALIEHAEPAHASNILLNRGSLQMYRGQLAAARQDLSRSAELAAEHGLLVEEFKAKHNLGYLEFLAGNLALALKTMDDAQANNAKVSLAVSLLDRARVLLEVGLHRESDDALIEAAAIFRADGLYK
jgi:tetratricopeptide (TPR) repeat protein